MNGNHAALRLVAPETPTTPVPPPAPEDPIERRIGELTADAVIVLTTGMREFGADGAMAAPTREQGGELLVKLYEIRQSMMTDDFAGLMHEHGRRILWQRNPEIFRTHPGTTIDPATFNRGISVLVDYLCAVLAQTTETERLYQLARAN